MTWWAAGTAVVGVAGSLFGAREQKKAAQQNAAASLAMYQQTQQNLEPYRALGSEGASRLRDLMGINSGQPLDMNAPLVRRFGMQDFQQSPAYQFNLQQGQMAIDKASNARGRLYNPATLQDIAKYSQGLASNEFQNSYNMYNQDQGNLWNKLYSLVGTGQNAAAQTGGFGAAATQAANDWRGQGANAGAAGIMGATNAITGGMRSAYDNYLMDQLQRQQQGTYSNSGGGWGIVT